MTGTQPLFIQLSNFLQHIRLPGLLILCTLYANVLLFAQPGGNSKGVPFITNYAPEDYNAHNQNWAIIQDQRGVMYFGNNHGVLEFDGVSWQLIKISKGNIVRSLALASNGTVFVGGNGDIGYLTADSISTLKYVSLLPQVDTNFNDFADVWQTLSTSHGIYFVTAKYVFKWDGKEMKTWHASTGYHVGFVVNDVFYVRQKQTGLMTFNGDKLVLAPLGERFGDELVMAMLPFSSNGSNAMLVATRTSGLMLYDGVSSQPFSTQADDILKSGLVYCGTKLPGNLYAFGTLQNGVVIIDHKGHLIHHLNKSSGLQDETIWYVYPDNQNGLWIGMHVGISRVEINTPHTYFGEKEGIEGSVLHIVRHNDLLYAASSMGIYYLEKNSSRFKRINDVAPQAWALLPFNEKVLAATFEGLFEINGTRGKLIDSVYAMSIARSAQDPNRIFIGMQSGIKSLYYTGKGWKDEVGVKGIEPEIDWIYEYPEGNIWLTTREHEIILLELPDAGWPPMKVTAFDSTNGLPPGDRTVAFSTAKGLRFGTDKGVYQFNDQSQTFTSDTTLIKGLSSTKGNIYSVTQGVHGNLWLVVNENSGVAWLQPDGTYKWDPSPFLRIENFDHYFAYRDPSAEDVTWIGCIDRVIRYDGRVEKKLDQNFNTLIRQVTVNGDSVLFAGAGIKMDGNLTLKYGYKSLRFNFAAPSFDETAKTVYQFMLEGFDTRWSNWTTETYKDYTGLPRGNYTFRVRARNIYNQVGETASVSFNILPPFYFSWWAIITYALIFAAGIYFFYKKQIARLQMNHLQQLKELEYEKLKELDQLKSRFFADISHEFRTPLTLILGPVESLLSANPPEERARQYTMIRRNAQRLLRLINQLLDLSKLESGKMKLDLHREDIIVVINGIVQSFESLVQARNMKMTFHSTLKEAFVYFDRDKMEQVITNLISNAVKFTPDGGQVMIDVSLDKKDNMLQIDVADTGLGIAQPHLAHVFDRFYQGSQASKAGEPGSGIGLALAKELVELHQGRISVKSNEGEGTVFTICLPFKKELSTSEYSSTSANGKRTSIAEEHFIKHDLVFSEEDEDQSSENTLLLVEDNPDMRSFIREALSTRFRIVESTDGQNGIEKALEIIPDIIVSDVMMPRKDGLELCETLKADHRTSHIPIILLTAKADIDSRLAGLERGADDYLAKPFNREELLIRSQNLLDIRQKLRERFSGIPILEPPVLSPQKEIQIEDAFLLKFRAYVESNLSDSDLEIDALAREMGMSRSQMFRKIKALTGQSPSLLIRNIRLQKGKELLEMTEMNVSEVAYTVGFSAPAYFSDAFTETFGIRPSQVKK